MDWTVKSYEEANHPPLVQLDHPAYIKARRLNAARRALAAAGPKRFSVTRIAMENGFTHLGRFSVDYRRHFGASPKQTLARRASSKV